MSYVTRENESWITNSENRLEKWEQKWKNKWKRSKSVLQDKIKSLIIKQNLKSGDLMPTENELIEQLGVSRSSLREAIKSLEALHILDIRHGVGTFVSESSLVPMIPWIKLSHPAEFCT